MKEKNALSEKGETPFFTYLSGHTMLPSRLSTVPSPATWATDTMPDRKSVV